MDVAAAGTSRVIMSEDFDGITREQVVKDPTCFYRYVEKRPVIGCLDQLPDVECSMVMPLRDRLIAPIWGDFEAKRTVASGFFDPNEPGDPTLAQRALMKEAVHDKSRESAAVACPNRELAEAITCEGSTVTLPDIDKIPLRTQFAIYNKMCDKALTVAGRKGNNEAVSMLLKADHGIIVHAIKKPKEPREWEVLSNYNAVNQSRRVNPLLIELPTEGEPPVCNGEPFLTREMIQDLAVDAGIPRPDFCEFEQTAHESFQKLLALKAGKELADGRQVAVMNLLFPADCSEHIVHLRLILDISKNAVFVYMHETVGPDLGVAQSIDDGFVNAVSSVYNNHRLYLVKPGFQLQKDSSSCTQLALESMKAFHQYKDLDDWVVETAEKADAIVTLPTRRQKKSKEHFSPINREKSCIPVEAMHAQLLTGLQSRALAFGLKKSFRSKKVTAEVGGQAPSIHQVTDAQLNTVIDNEAGLTLREHYKKHFVDVPVKGNADQKRSHINLYAMGGRYQNALKWKKLKEENIAASLLKRKLPLPAPSKQGTSKKVKKTSVSDKAFTPLRDALGVGGEMQGRDLITLAVQNMAGKKAELEKKDQQIAELQQTLITEEAKWQDKYSIQALEASELRKLVADKDQEIARQQACIMDQKKDIENQRALLAQIHKLSA